MASTRVELVAVLPLGILWLIVLSGVLVAVGGILEGPPPRWPCGVVAACGIAVCLLAVPAGGAISAVEQVSGTDRMPPFELQLSGLGMLMLAGTVTILVPGIDRKVNFSRLS